MKSIHTLQALILAVALVPVAAQAQTGPGMMLVPYPAQANFEGAAEAIVFGSANTNFGNNFDLTIYQAEGRVYCNHEYHDEAVTVGGGFVHLGIESNDPRVPEPLTDVAAEIGTKLGTWDEYDIFATGGVGYAGDSSLNDGDALYFTGNLFGVTELSDTETFVIGVNFDGNRVIWQDIPLPLIAYTERVSDTFSYTVGLPFASLRWQPEENLVITADSGLTARVEYTAQEGVILYGTYENVMETFHVQNAKNTRWFFQQQRVEGGVIWVPAENISVFAGGGFAFETEFETGWDIRDTNTIVDISDEAYVRFGVDVWTD